MEGSSVANIAGKPGGSVLVFGASPRLGYENSFTGNEICRQRGKTAPPDWPWPLSSPSSTADRPLWACHSRSCLTRACECIVTAHPLALLWDDFILAAILDTVRLLGHIYSLHSSVFFPLSPLQTKNCTPKTTTDASLGRAVRQLGFHFCRTAKLLAGYLRLPSYCVPSPTTSRV